MIDGYWDKAPSELVDRTVEFSSDIPSGDAIKAIGGGSATTATAVDSAGADATSTIISSVTVSGTTLVIKLQAGTAGMNYKVTAIIELNTAGTKIEKHFEVRVRTGRRSF